MYIHSIYTKLFTEDSKYYVYNSQSNFFCEISEQFYNTIQDREWTNIPADVFQQLIDKKIIVKKGEEYDFFYSELLRFNMRCYNSSTLNLVLVPTTACNFDCPYCFEPKSNPKVMTSDTITLVKDFISNFKDIKRMSVTWYGGEPLLALDTIKELSEMLRGDDMPEIISESIVTNGYLFNREVIVFFKGTNLADIQITLDGNKSRHDKTRCLKSGGKPTYDVILDNIDNILKEMPEVNLSIRVNVNKENFNEFIEIYNYFKTKYDGFKNLNIYPGLIREETSDGKSLRSNCFTVADEAMIKELLYKEGIRGNIFPHREYRGCMANTLNAYIIGPEGELYKCWNDVTVPEAVVGNIADYGRKTNNRLLTFMTQATPFVPECKKCLVFPLCGGGCSYHRLRNIKENANFVLCSPYKDFTRLKKSLFDGVKIEQIHQQQAADL